jgi:aspartate kinase
MKFGGASVATPDHFGHIADIIIERSKQFQNVVVVVSAMGDTTNNLIELAYKVNPDPPRREYDMLVTVGERISIALLAMALAKKGVEAVSFTGSQSGIITCNKHSDARIVNIKPHRITKELDLGKIVIVAGFQGVSEKGEITTLGRGGSDTTAVALACALNASFVQFLKDVPGVFNEDPKKNPEAEIQHELSYSSALKIVLNGAKILHSRCIILAQKNNVKLHVCSFLDNGEKIGTLIHELGKEQLEKPIYEEFLHE